MLTLVDCGLLSLHESDPHSNRSLLQSRACRRLASALGDDGFAALAAARRGDAAELRPHSHAPPSFAQSTHPFFDCRSIQRYPSTIDTTVRASTSGFVKPRKEAPN